VRAPEQRVSRVGALKAVTLDAAYSLHLEKDVGSIVPGKLANFTILADNPVTVEPIKIKDIKVWGTVQEGRVLPVASPAGASVSIESDRGDAGRLAAGGSSVASDDLFAQLVTEHLTRVLGHGH
jgi:adenine deaminase